MNSLIIKIPNGICEDRFEIGVVPKIKILFENKIEIKNMFIDLKVNYYLREIKVLDYRVFNSLFKEIGEVCDIFDINVEFAYCGNHTDYSLITLDSFKSWLKLAKNNVNHQLSNR